MQTSTSTTMPPGTARSSAAAGIGGLWRRRTQPAPLAAMMARFPQAGRVVWIGIRAGKRGAVEPLEQVEAQAGLGLAGDHYAQPERAGRGQRKRQVTLIQAEHLAVLGALLGEPPIDPARLRRNLVVSGINLLALKDKRFRIGSAVLVMTGLAHPCSRMEETLGAGGYNAMRGHGGITAAVLTSGTLAVGDLVVPLDPPDADAGAD
ncbi:MOSC domain-containing protein [uncultured Thiohalocapsa sp.]|uniref:MOSC domain-containing protein n=1 Tax=uncultured Thiohalocapsa sp. TaxID=768990 RepID=UPI0025F98BC3|nr:MOSC domain-containing protein [uncultured Thiohalocapsa sp.]